MNTDTPETDQWEAYCDECYYHMWRLRRKTERGWHDGFHIHTGDAAKGLCEILNNLERERDETREQRDRLAETLQNCRDDLEMILLEHYPNPSETWCSLLDADAVLQSLTTKP